MIFQWIPKVQDATKMVDDWEIPQPQTTSLGLYTEVSKIGHAKIIHQMGILYLRPCP